MEPIWKLKSIKEAMSRNEFYAFLDLGVKTLLFKAYRMTPVTYPKLVTFETSTRNKESYPSHGSAELPEKVLEGQSFPARNFAKQDVVEITNFKFGEIIEIHEELLDDDQTNRIKDFPLDLGKAHAKFEDKSVYSIITANANTYDSQAFFSLNHPGFTGGPAIADNDNLLTNVTLTANAIAQALGIISRWTSHTSDDILDVTATDLVVPENLGHTADLLTESKFLGLAFASGILGPAASTAQAKNVIQNNGLGVIKSPRLDGTSTTDWYIKTDFPGFVFQWRQKLKLFKENENSGVRFDRDVFRWKSRVRFGLEIINWRSMMLVS